MRLPLAYAHTVQDSFTRANSITTLGTADTGQAWTAHSGTWGIISNAAYLVTQSGDSVATVNCGKSDIDFSVDYAGSNVEMGIVFRATDQNNYLLLYVNGPFNALELWQRVSGAYTNLQKPNVGAISTSGTLRVVTAGTSITGYLNGVSLLTHTTSQFQTNTRIGLRRNATGGTSFTWDNLVVL